ncbi:MAG: alpha-1,4-polygalactosaminidase [Rhodospirillaceae bacterium]
MTLTARFVLLAISALVLSAIAALPGGTLIDTAQAQDTHNAPVVIDGMDLTDQVYEEAPYPIAPENYPNWRDDMREIINTLSEFARAQNPDFITLLRGGVFLATMSQRELDVATLAQPDGVPLPPSALRQVGAFERRFLRNVSGFVMEDLYCRETGRERPDAEIRRRLLQESKVLISLEHCNTPAEAAEAIGLGATDRVLVAAGTDGDGVFDELPALEPFMTNAKSIQEPDRATNVFAMLSSRRFARKDDWIGAMTLLNHDILIVDPFFNGDIPLDVDDVERLKYKFIGARRQVIARLTVGFAEDTRYYWQSDWTVGNPPFLTGFLPGNDGTYWVDYRNQQWREIVGATYAGLMALGFDGVMLDGIAVVFRDEAMTPL